MKTFVVSALSIVLVSILFCPMVMAAPTMPADLQMVQPDPSLPKELSAFFGKWEGPSVGFYQFFLIVEKIDEEKASLYVWQIGQENTPPGWTRYEAKVIKERRKYKIWYPGRFGNAEYTLKGEHLVASTHSGSRQLKRVP
jgi:hypothetical protein